MTSTRGNGGIIGKDNDPSTIKASGVWSLAEAERAKRVGKWPYPYVFSNLIATTPADYNNGQSANRNIRCTFANAQISNLPANFVRVTFYAGDTQGLTIAGATIGIQATVGNVYDYASTPVQLLFAGSPGFSIASGQTIVSDPAALSVSGSQSLLVAYFISAMSGVGTRTGGLTGWGAHYKDGSSEISVVDVSGYSSLGYPFGVMKIEGSV